MSPTSIPAGTVVALDRQTRQALRNELEVSTGDDGDFSTMVHNGDRAQFFAKIKTLEASAGMLDKIGWTEQGDAPDSQPIAVDAALASWASHQADALARALRELDRDDIDDALDALAGLRAIAAADTMPM